MKVAKMVAGLVALAAVIGDMPSEAGQDPEGWYEFRPQNDTGPSAIGMQEWLDKPAGRLGRIAREGDRLIYGGRPIKLWGLNLCYGACAPDKELADRRAAFYAKYGVNTVRLHKFADGPGWAGVQSKESFAEYDAEGLDRMDYQVARFKEAGIYVTLSAHFGALKLGPADRADVPYLDELGTFDGRSDRVTAPHSAFFYSPELQNLQIRQIVNLLKHKNAHTGRAYAEEPAVAAIEIINEQSVLFYTSMGPLKQSPTLRKHVAGRFSDWLQKKYGSQEGLVKAWGSKALDGFQHDGFPASGEHLDKRNLLPLGNPWYWDPDQMTGSQAYRRQRLLDTLQFLYELQCEAYDRYVAAVRQAGYEGEILGSNWQAGRAVSHYANLHSDYRVGMIDRHNYYGGGGGKRGERFKYESMLMRAGSGMLSSGLQQVADRPFMLSEWIHVFPNEWGVEGPAILGAYGMGLQGWDVSYLFQNRDTAAFSAQLGRDAWDVTAPQVLGVFPAVARQVLRGDVKESDVVAVRNVHVPSLFEGKLGFDDKVVQGYDDKQLDSNKVSARALAVAKCVVAFTEAHQETPAFRLAPYQQDRFLISSTGELRWLEGLPDGPSGYFTLNTPATKAVVGFADISTCELGSVTILPKCRFAAIYVTAQEKDRDLDSSRNVLVVALGRARNSGMEFSDDETKLLAKGQPPILLEPVKATIVLRRPGARRVILLDHDGRPTQRTAPIQNGTFTLDGARDKTPYYLIQY